MLRRNPFFFQINTQLFHSISLRYKGLLVVTVINIIEVLLLGGGWYFAIYTVQVVISDSMDTVDSLAGVNSYLWFWHQCVRFLCATEARRRWWPGDLVLWTNRQPAVSLDMRRSPCCHDCKWYEFYLLTLNLVTVSTIGNRGFLEYPIHCQTPAAVSSICSISQPSIKFMFNWIIKDYISFFSITLGVKYLFPIIWRVKYHLFKVFHNSW